MKRRISYLLIACMMILSLASCTRDPKPPVDPSGPGKPVSGGEITVAMYSDLDSSLDPHESGNSAATREIMFNIYEGLVKIDSEGNIIPALAESYSQNESADEYTFKIRQGVKFHDGSLLEMEDVVYCLRRAAGLDSGVALVAAFSAVKEVEQIGGDSVKITLNAPDTEFLPRATAAIFPRDIDPVTQVCGTGPFKLTSRVVQDSIVLEKNKDYWGTPAYLDKVVLKVYEDGEALVMSLRSGASDMAMRLGASQIAELDNLNIIEGSNNLVQALYLNNAVKPFDDVRVRQALSYAVDKQEVIDLASDGYGTPIGSSMYPAFGKYFMPELTDYYTRDIEKAKKLLADAGYPNGFEFTIAVPSNMPPHIDTAQVLVEMFKEIGVSAKIELVEWATWLDEVYIGRNYQSTIVGVDARDATASDLLSRFVSTAADNFTNYSSPAFDKVYAQAKATSNDEEQTKLFKDCQRVLTEEAAAVYIQDLASFVVMEKGLEGYLFYPLYITDFAAIYRTE